MSEIVGYKPGAIAAATSTLNGYASTMSHQTDDFANSGQQYVASGAGQFTDQVQTVVNQQRQLLGEAIDTTRQIIQAVTEATEKNGARDQRSASSIL
ncbi:hypothetical protein MTY66_61190 (plasmid) [Mycolicibacterium sp. TY66]|uniref:hypothetical protein n=1 Tax=unclassified Mycolicibacterium TaxID=2636767 RepID=UPI001BB316DD|nr:MULTISPECIES: hypothetical protein [unclassified Mycolicibacterium]BCI84494.1 hypothetical protein MTY66_61190 [Mycolicibacterium sp. TY66]BCJ84726.1 hypothetical protein MTY81_60990 [Mycolicibacterium sp. TY81]